MSRVGAALFLLCVATRGSAQTASSAATLAGNGHTISHSPNRSPSVSQGRPGPVGLAAGLSNWPVDKYCGSGVTATVQPLAPRDLLDRLQLASRCGVRLVLVIPRRFLTSNHKTTGPFSVDSAKRATDLYADVLTPDTLRKYSETLLGLNLGDDYGCKQCWGGQSISQAQIADWAAYTRSRLPGLPLGVRHTPDWVARSPALASQIDYVWAQYHTKRGDANAYFDDAGALATRLGLRIVMGINAHNCYGKGTKPCSADELITLGRLAVTNPATCAFLSWRYDAASWEKPDIQAAWDSLFALARARPATDCRRTTRGT